MIPNAHPIRTVIIDNDIDSVVFIRRPSSMVKMKEYVREKATIFMIVFLIIIFSSMESNPFLFVLF